MSQFVPLSLMLIMFSMGLSLHMVDFKRLFLMPVPILAGLLGQLIVLPIVALLVARYFELNSVLAAGLLLLALCPGGIISNLASMLARANMALSVTLTTISSLLAALTVPLLFNWGQSFLGINLSAFQLDFWNTVMQIAIMTIFPIALGMLINANFRLFARKYRQWVSRIAALSFGIMIMFVWKEGWHDIEASARQLGWAALTLNVSTICIGFLIARILGLPFDQRVVLGLEVGIQNSALAVVIATVLIGDVALAVPAAVYSITMVISAMLIVVYSRWRMRAQLEPAISR
jgi:BASS family bile acid:Na+ symporter